MALDSFTLEWFKREIVESSNRKLLKGKVDSWSALQNPDTEEYQREDSEDHHSFYSYHTIVRLIRQYFAEKNPYEELKPFHAEFFIWPEIQLTMAAEAFYGQDVGSEEAVTYMIAYLGGPNNRTDKLNNAKDKFRVCKNLFRELSIGEKLKFLENRIQQMKELYPVEAEAATPKQ